jgi:hypothetical protein
VGRATRALFLRGKMLKKKSQHPPSFGGVRRRPLSKAQEHFPGACAMLNKAIQAKCLSINDIHILRAPSCVDFHNRSARVIHSQRRQAEASLCRSFESDGRLGWTDGVVVSDDFRSETMMAWAHGGRATFIPEAGPAAAGTPAGCKEADPSPGPSMEFRLIVPDPCSY